MSPKRPILIACREGDTLVQSQDPEGASAPLSTCPPS